MQDTGPMLITGCEGFVGSHLADALELAGYDVHGTIYGDSSNIEHLRSTATFHQCDLRDERAIQAIVKEVRPKRVFHLAAQSYVTVSWMQPRETLQSNVLGTFNLLDALTQIGHIESVVVVSSSATYGPRTSDEMPLSEATMLRPSSVYGATKVAEEALAHYAWLAHRLPTIIVRPFNMTGPRKKHDACADFTRSIVLVEAGQRTSIRVGNLGAVRDITDGRDAARALMLIAEHATPGEVYNLCTGIGRSMQEVLDLALVLGRISVPWEVAPEIIRGIDDPVYVGDNKKLKELDWHPAIPLEQTLEDSLEYWRQHLGDAY